MTCLIPSLSAHRASTKLRRSHRGIATLILWVGIISMLPALEAATPASSRSAAPLNAAAVNQALALGVNIGNTFDLNQHPTDFAKIKPLIDLYADAGLKHIRIPITWTEGFDGDALADPLGTINLDHPRFRQLQALIDYALQQGLYVVINAHHEREFKRLYNGSRVYEALFAHLWTQIATHFAAYPQQLIFELLNEPEGALGDSHDGTDYRDPVAIAFTRRIAEIGHEVIRQTGGLNQTRIIMIPTNRQGNQSALETVYPDKNALPGQGHDPYLIIQVHTYDPWSFCGQDGTNAAYPGQAAIAAPLLTVAAHGKRLGVPINYGEFGVGRQHNQADRDSDVVREYYKAIAQTTLSSDMSATAWDDRGWFRLVETKPDGSYQFSAGIIPAMLRTKP